MYDLSVCALPLPSGIAYLTRGLTLLQVVTQGWLLLQTGTEKPVKPGLWEKQAPKSPGNHARPNSLHLKAMPGRCRHSFGLRLARERS